MRPMKVQDFNWDDDAVLNLMYLHLDVNNNSDKYEEWKHCLEHSYLYIADMIHGIPVRTRKFAILFSLHERSLKREGKMFNEDGLTDYESAIAAMSEIMNSTTESGAPYHTVNDVRFCDVCGMPMCDGWMIDPYSTCGGHYCSDRCAKSDMCPDEFKEFIEDGSLFYTEWEGSGDSDEVELIN